MDKLEEQFHHAVMSGNEKAKKLGYNATYFQRMIDQYGSLETAKRLLAKQEIQQGLMTLCELGCLDESIEALVIQERFHDLFTEAEISEATRRLDELGYFK
jgi:5-methylcytosine-specific restriction protein A